MKRRVHALVIPLLLAALTSPAAAASTVVVSPTHMDGWAEDSTPPANVTFVNGPGTPPLGVGSARFQVDATGATDAELRNGLYNGISLGAISSVNYWTWVTKNGGGLNNSCQAVYILLNVDRYNTGTVDDFLFFEPCYQNGTYSTLSYSGPVPNQCGSNPACVSFNTWQFWNAKIGGWWSADDSAGGPPLTTLSAYAAQYPMAVIRNGVGPTKGGVRLTAGFGGPTDWGQFDGNTDAFTIGIAGRRTVTYNFEPAGACQRGGGDGDFEDKDGHKHHAHFDKNSCDNGSGDVEDDDRDSGKHFQSTSVSSATFTSDLDGNTLTMVGMGLDDGLPVGFTMIAVDYGGLTPSVFTLTLTNGRSFTGALVNGILSVE